MDETTIKGIGKDEVYESWFKCIKCKYSTILDDFKYCPRCGRKINKIIPREREIQRIEGFQYKRFKGGN